MENTEKTNMYKELKAWADKWGVSYEEGTLFFNPDVINIFFDSADYNDPCFSYNTKTGDFAWYGGD